MGVALLVLGIALFVSPIGATLLVVRVMGWVLLAAGALTLAGCWRRYARRFGRQTSSWACSSACPAPASSSGPTPS